MLRSVRTSLRIAVYWSLRALRDAVRRWWLTVFATVVSVVAALPLAAQNLERPWEDPNGPYCFDLYFSTATARLNAYNGSPAFNALKPYGFSPWGHTLASNVVATQQPDDWHRHGANRNQYVWEVYSRAGRWGNVDWDSAQIPHLHPFVLDCIRRMAAGTGPGGVGPGGVGPGGVGPGGVGPGGMGPGGAGPGGIAPGGVAGGLDGTLTITMSDGRVIVLDAADIISMVYRRGAAPGRSTPAGTVPGSPPSGATTTPRPPAGGPTTGTGTGAPAAGSGRAPSPTTGATTRPPAGTSSGAPAPSSQGAPAGAPTGAPVDIEARRRELGVQLEEARRTGGWSPDHHYSVSIHLGNARTPAALDAVEALIRDYALCYQASNAGKAKVAEAAKAGAYKTPGDRIGALNVVAKVFDQCMAAASSKFQAARNR